MTVPVFILAGQSNAALLSSNIEAALNAEYGAGNFELVKVYNAGAPLTRERADLPDWSNPDELREDLTEETVNALLEGDDHVFGGMIWVQGEADTYYEYGASRYADTLEGLFDDLRDDVSNVFGNKDVGIDDAPITILELSEHAPDAASRAGWDTVIDAQREVAEHDPQVQTLNPDTLAEDANIPADDMFDDGLHYSDEVGDLIAQSLVETLAEASDENDRADGDYPVPVVDIVETDEIEAERGSDRDDSDDDFAFDGMEWLLGLLPIFGVLTAFA